MHLFAQVSAPIRRESHWHTWNHTLVGDIDGWSAKLVPPNVKLLKIAAWIGEFGAAERLQHAAVLDRAVDVSGRIDSYIVRAYSAATHESAFPFVGREDDRCFQVQFTAGFESTLVDVIQNQATIERLTVNRLAGKHKSIVSHRTQKLVRGERSVF